MTFRNICWQTTRILKLFNNTAIIPLTRSLTTMKLDTPEFHALFTPELKQLADIFSRNNFELRMAGGAVRDLLMNIKPSDIDFATTATPSQMKELFEKEQIRMLHKKGEEHGTITCRINDENFEVTTLRIDVVCDGRRASVQYTTDWKLDAFRRDLTVNSLFLNFDGTIYDYTGGITDVKNRRIAFVGDPAQRIQEDYLRILRYFRFFGRLAKTDSEHDPRNLEAIIKHRDGIKFVSGERIWTELRKIVIGRLASPVVRCMLERCGLGPQIALVSGENARITEALKEFERVASANSDAVDSPLQIESSTALASLCISCSDAGLFQKRCKCSNADRELVEFIVRHREVAMTQPNDVRLFKHMILDLVFLNGQDQMEISRNKCQELLKYTGSDENTRRTITEWEIDVFPANGIDLMRVNVERGPRMRSVLAHLYNIWKKSDLKASKDELLGHVNDSEIDEIEIGKSKKRKRISKSPPKTDSTLPKT